MVFWISAFLDFTAADFESEVAFWSDVTGYAVSPARGAEGEFATLVPPDGDDFLRVQRLADGLSGIHLDLHVEDPLAAADRAVELGASVVVRHRLGYVVLTSPGGFTFCLVSHPASVRPAPGIWPGGVRSIVDQVCLDIPLDRHDTECAFWTALTGWELRQSPVAKEIHHLVRPVGMPIRLLLQRLGEAAGQVRAHPDLACSDRAAETTRHLALGADLVRENDRWTVLRSPAGSAYCITDRDPITGMLD
jgi:hypothetical protein